MRTYWIAQASLTVKNLPAMQERPGFDLCVGKTLWRREQLPTQVIWPGESHGQRSLGGYRPWGHRERLPLSLSNYKSNMWLLCVHAQSLSYVRLCNHNDCRPPGSSVFGILSARIQEWVAISLSRGSSWLRDQNSCLLHWQADSLPLSHHGSMWLL